LPHDLTQHSPINQCRELGELFRRLLSELQAVVRFDYLNLILHDVEHGLVRVRIIESKEGTVEPPYQEVPFGETPSSAAIESQQPLIATTAQLSQRWPKVAQAIEQIGRIETLGAFPLTTARRQLGALGIGRGDPVAFTAAEVDFISQVAKLVAVAVDNALAFGEIGALKDKLAEERLYLENEIRSDQNFEQIIGESRSLHQALNQVQVVAPTDSTVLILGETGTGKELLARAIHDRSDRRERTFVKINCAAIPSGLLESELFGHEKGAFTGAIAQKIGRFEVANGGTLFLDEVGEIPIELQPKLLRVLQEQEFERLGGTKTIKVNVRLVAATNRNLAKMVEQREFREDLYYRLNVFPLSAPPLRERPEDIPALVRYFAQRFARRMKRRIEVIPTAALEVMQRYPWPGNVRELKNLVERAVILSPGRTLEVPIAELERQAVIAVPTDGNATLESMERAHILRALEETHWVLGGPKGAAVRLGMKRTSLQWRMQKLGIARPK
jgi:formate hydrogenlyase transcriptional activator